MSISAAERDRVLLFDHKDFHVTRPGHPFGMSRDLVTHLTNKASLLSHARVSLAEKYQGTDKSLARPTSLCILMVRMFRLMLVSLYI